LDQNLRINEGWLTKAESANEARGMRGKTIKRLLLIDGNSGDARVIREMFNEGSCGTHFARVERMSEAEAHLAECPVDLILLDPGLPDAQGIDAVRRAHVAAPHVPLVVMTRGDDRVLATQALQEGAQDYLVKGQLETRGLIRALGFAVERKSMEQALFKEKERAQVTLNSIGDAVACTDASGNLSFLNSVAETMTGWSRKDATGRPLADVVHIVNAGTKETIPNPMEMVTTQDRSMHLPPNCVLIRRDGGEIPIEDSVAPMHDPQGKAMGAVIVFRDVSAARAMALKMEHSAQHDFLTGLPNRMLFSDRVGQAITLARRHHKHVAVLFLDLDGFKHINDSLGHPTGDKLLQSIAQRLVAIVRGADTVSRQGGDEFVVLLSEVERAEDAAVTAKRMLQGVAGAHLIEAHALHVTASIGVSVFPDDGQDAETLIKNADTAMYQAKANGHQSFKFFTPAMNVRAVERQSIEESLRSGLERQEFALHYQPKINLRTGEISGAEALLRWTHPVRGPVSPAHFIPVAEESGLILPIGNWALREACRQAREWLDAGLPMTTMAVNISAMEFRGENFLEGVFRILDETGLDPAFLELELTESVLMKRAESTEWILNALRARGVQLAIDDFGTGYSSLSYLRKFPIDALKIDQSFVRQIGGASGETTIVSAVIGMARSLKLRVVAEGVETAEELNFLQDQQCDEAQGYLFSRPVPSAQFAHLLENGVPAALPLCPLASGMHRIASAFDAPALASRSLSMK
jgi:diguanylate cyclase (GGDEF)-like protein/PAS domain S-box-containing protein